MKSNLEPAVFCYAIPSTVVGLGATVAPQINFNNDSDFMLTEIRCNQQAIGAILMQLSLSSGELLSNVAIDTNIFAGTNYPVRLPLSVRIKANSQLNVQLQNTTAGNLTMQIQFWGYKVDRSE